MKNKKSSISGLDANIVILICYLATLLLALFQDVKFIAWLLPFTIYIIERDSEFIKKHALQSTLLFAVYSGISMIVSILSLLVFKNANINTFSFTNFAGSLSLFILINVISFIALIFIITFTIITVTKTYKYEDYDIPIIKNYLPKFKNFIDKLTNSDKVNKNNSDIIVEEESEVIMDVEIEDKNENEKLETDTKKTKEKNNIKKKESDKNE